MGNQYVAALKQKIDKILSINKEALVSRSEWGNINFAAANAARDSIYEIAGILAGLPYDRLPDNAAGEINDSLERALQWLGKNDAFRIEVGNPISERDTIVQHLSSMEQDLYRTTQQWIPFLAYLKGDIPRQLSQIQNTVLVAEDRGKGFGDWLTGRQQEFDKIIQATREASAKAGVAVFTRDFLEEAIARESEATSWLRYSVIAAAATVAAALVFYFIPVASDTASIVQHSTSKLVILSIFVAAFVWCANNYKTNRHLATINRHKSHALSTFQAFVHASEDEAVRGAVLLETTRAIFAHGATGYLKADPGVETASKVVEVFRTHGKIPD